MLRRRSSAAVSVLVGISLAANLLFVPRLFAANDWGPTGDYSFTHWAGPALDVYYSIPPGSGAQTPILIVMPGVKGNAEKGAKRNAEQYRNEWNHLAVADRFITLVVGATTERFPTEYEYNVGGVIDADHRLQPEEKWLFSAIDPLFDDFKQQFGSSRERYSIYGHSAGGGFVHLFMLFKPHAKVDRAVAANPAFYTVPDPNIDFPFGLRGAPLADDALEEWFAKPLTLLLGERDLDPRTQPLSNGLEAQHQGPHGYARGLGFFYQALCVAKSKQVPLQWRLEIVPDVGHSDTHMSSHAVRYLIGN